jgi:hypothetical protein
MEREEERISKKKVKASGPYFICLRLDTALEILGLEKAACFHNCGCNWKLCELFSECSCICGRF